MSENKSESKFGIAGESFTLAAVLVAVPTLVFVMPVLNYKVPRNNRELARVQESLHYATEDYYEIRDNVIRQSRDTLENDSTYMGLLNQLYAAQDAGQTQKAVVLQNQLDSLENHLRNEYISSNRELNVAADWKKSLAAHASKLQRDSVIRDSIVRQPFKTRFTNNWVQMRTDFHNSMAQYHNKRLNILQTKKLNQR